MAGGHHQSRKRAVGEAGAKVADLRLKYGMSDATYYDWRAKYAGMTVSDLRRLKALESENRRLKQIIAEQNF
jgi:putative transposase